MAIHLRGIIILMFCTFQLSLMGQMNLNVNLYSGLKSSFGIKAYHSKGVITLVPIKENNGLDVNDLNAYLKMGDVILKASTGSVLFTAGVFLPNDAMCKLSIRAKESVDFSTTLINTAKIEVDIRTKGNIHIYASGITSNSGNIHLEGKDIYIKETGIRTAGGKIELCASNSILISGSGLDTKNGDVVMECSNLVVEMNGIHASGGKCNIFVKEQGTIGGVGIKSRAFSGTGKSLVLNGDGLAVSTSVNINFSEEVSVLKEGIQMKGWPLYIKAKDLIIGGDEGYGGSGIVTNGGSVNLEVDNNLTVQARGLYTAKGKIYIRVKNDVWVRFGGITTLNESIYLESIKGKITLDGMNLNSRIDQKTNGGKLDTSNINSKKLILLTEPVVGGGDITIVTH
ncbi:MAG: hypothetical protein IPN72_11835 [Saprospiraceae bacterium]|nr:hypothetical protein [Saprospiraceae bacterium]